MITFKQKGNFNKTEKFLRRVSDSDYLRILEKYGREGVNALADATPKDTGETAQSWDYEIQYSNGKAKITWTNSNIVDGVPIAILIQYGHGTKNGGYVQGQDYINPTMKPIFDKILNDVWREVTAL